MQLSRINRTLLSIGLALTLGTTVALAAETGGTVTCKDGTTSAAGRGACSHHGGVAKSGTDATATEGSAAAAAPVTCKDGTTSKGGRGACRGHGGVAKDGGTGA